MKLTSLTAPRRVRENPYSMMNEVLIPTARPSGQTTRGAAEASG
jgi:hypothetical protein